MPVKIDCPRCQCRLSVAERKAGSYVRCPQCRARLWIPAEGDEGERETTALVVRARPVAPAKLNGENGRRTNVARLIRAETAVSSLRLADDGEFPELHLHEATAVSAARSGASLPPLATILLVGLSVAASVAVWFVFDDPASSAGSAQKQAARAAIEKDFFAEMDGLPHYPYQVRLREAQRTHLRGDYRQERELYRQVLGMLRAERKPETGVTGGPGRDEELERHLIILLGN
jgi:hypothetical protein